MERMKLNIQLFATITTTIIDLPYDDQTGEKENKSAVGITAYFKASSSSTWFNKKTIYFYCKIVNKDGTETDMSPINWDNTPKARTMECSLSQGGSVSKTFYFYYVPHQADGTLKVRCYWTIATGTSGLGTITESQTTKTQDMATIPRASYPTLSSSSVAMGSSVTIYTNRASDSFTHTIRYAFGNASGTIASNVTTNTTWTPPLTLANQIPSATSGQGTIYCDTYSGGTFVGTNSVGITLNVPSSVVPTISTITLQENGDVPSGWGVYVQNKSKLKITYSASGAYGSTISSYTTTADGYTYTGNAITTNYIRTSGNITISGKVVDSRNRQGTKTSTPYIYPYTNPTISTAQVQRCDINGNVDNNGEYCLISYGASISSCNGNNTSTYKVGYRTHNVGSYTYVPLATNVVSFSASGMLYTDGIYAADRGSGTKVEFSSLNTYDIQFYVADYFMANDSNVQQLDTGFDLMNFNPSGKAMAIGKVSEAGANEELLEIGMNTDINNNLNVDGMFKLKNKEVLFHSETPEYGLYTILAADGNSVYLRPNGAWNSTGQAYVSANGDVTINGNLNIGGERLGTIHSATFTMSNATPNSWVKITNDVEMTLSAGNYLLEYNISFTGLEGMATINAGYDGNRQGTDWRSTTYTFNTLTSSVQLTKPIYLSAGTHTFQCWVYASVNINGVYGNVKATRLG